MGLAACGFSETSSQLTELRPADGGIPPDSGFAADEEQTAPDDFEPDEPEVEGPHRDRVEHDDRWVQAAIDAWEERAEIDGDVPAPAVDRCFDVFDDLEVLVPDDETFRRLCQRCNTVDEHPVCDRWGRIYACAPFDHHGAYIVLDRKLADYPQKRAALTVHEAIHHLGACSGAGSDAAHSEDEWWCSRRGCIEGDALR